MTVRIRGHHLLCMLTYVGKGYSEAFTKGYDKVVQRLSSGEDMLLVAGPDDICQPLLADPDPHCFRDTVPERDRLAANAVETLIGRTIDVGERFSLDASTIKRMREAFHAGTTRQACNGCEWFDLCSSIADSGFREVRLDHRHAKA
ncbi:DUF1284 domain-containing protein [Mesorhizobium amorphae]|uniref:DUF1284 domain-containing protein n=1 Tax=Mesorhizobium amorphae TaxID=71433 RepID=UPI001184361C|nr:DUF1284 domain-containing protein [Mesorhizobium amorphae]